MCFLLFRQSQLTVVIAGGADGDPVPPLVTRESVQGTGTAPIPHLKEEVKIARDWVLTQTLKTATQKLRLAAHVSI